MRTSFVSAYYFFRACPRMCSLDICIDPEDGAEQKSKDEWAVPMQMREAIVEYLRQYGGSCSVCLVGSKFRLKRIALKGKRFPWVLDGDKIALRKSRSKVCRAGKEVGCVGGVPECLQYSKVGWKIVCALHYKRCLMPVH